MPNYLDSLFTKHSAVEAIDLYEKIAAVEALEHFSRSEPSDMDEEELRGWRSARSRVLSVSSSTDNPSEAEEKLQEIIDGSPNPQNSRDRGRLRGLNEALDALTKNTSNMGEVEKAPNGSDTDMERRDYFNQNAHPNPGTPGAGGYEHDWGVGTGPMPRTSFRTSAKIPPVNRSGLYDLMKFVELQGESIEWEEFKNSSAVNNKELDSLLEVLTEMGAAENTDGQLGAGSFKIDEDKLLDVVAQREDENE